MESPTNILTLKRSNLIRMRSRLRARILVVLALLMLVSAEALADGSVVVIKSAASGLYDDVIDSAREIFRSQCRNAKSGCEQIDWAVTDIESGHELDSALSQPVEAVVALGEKAATWLSERKQIPGPVFFSLIPRSTFDTIRPVLPDALEYSALYLDQPLNRQLQLIQACCPQRTQVGVLTGPVSQYLMPELRAQAKTAGLVIHEGRVDTFKEIGPALKDLMDDSDVLLSLPDPLVFNQRTIFSILLSTYHNQIPVVGFSNSYVQAGALIAVYSTPEQIGRQLGESLSAHFVDPHKPTPPFEYPRYFSIARNASVARSLQITLSDDETLLRQLHEGAR